MAAPKAVRFGYLEEQMESDFIKEIVSKSSNDLYQNLLEIKFGSVIYFSDFQKCIYTQSVLQGKEEDEVMNSSSHSQQQEHFLQKLILTTTPYFSISKLTCSSSGNHALLYGDHGIVVVELPRCWGDNSLFEGGKKKIHCRSTILDKSFFEHHVSLRIIQAAWYPGSPNNSHIIVLTDDNCLRVYDITRPDQPMLKISLFDHVSSFTSKNNFSNVTGDTAAGFDFAEPSDDSLGNKVYPVYVMQESGDLWVLHCKFSRNRIHVEQQGPLTMNPPSDDNYGCDYCSIICLPTTPTTIAMATKSGTVYHCLVIVGDDDDYDDQSSFVDGCERFPTEALYVYESVRLDLNFLHGEDGNYSEREELSHIMLKRDGDCNDSYLSISNGGVHTIAVPWVHELDRFLQPDSRETDGIGDLETPAEIQYVLCTKPSSSSSSGNIVCGCVMLPEESSMVCLLSSGELVHVNINRSSKYSWKNESDIQTNTQIHSSPLRQLRSVGQFHNYISKILTKEATIPVFKCGSSDMIPPDVYYKLLTKTTQILREEYIQKMLLAKAELEKRRKILKDKKEEQQEESELLRNDEALRDKGEELAAKLEQAQGNMNALSERVLTVFKKIQNSSPVLSNEEKEWAQELKLMQNRVTRIRRLSEVVKTKHESLILQNIPSTSKLKTSAKPALPTTQAIKVRGVLKDQGSVIGKLVEEVQELSLRIGT